jgi:hypothetical protein
MPVQPSDLDEFSRHIQSKGYSYYFAGCNLWYGTDKYDKKIEVDYVGEIGGERDYAKAFARLLIKENLAKLGTAGDFLYVRETAQLIKWMPNIVDGKEKKNGTGRFIYKADETESDWLDIPERLKPIMWNHCCSNGAFKELASIWFKITGVRAERVQGTSVQDIIAEGVDFHLIESMLLNSWGRLKIEDCCWFNGDAGCGNYCPDCGEKAVAKANKSRDADDDEYILEGFGQETCDGSNVCDGCGVDLRYWLTEHGMESELSHFEENLEHPYCASEKYGLWCLFESAIHSHGLNVEEWNNTDEKKDLAQRLLKLAWRIVIDACYPGSWERNDWVFVYEIERCERPE